MSDLNLGPEPDLDAVAEEVAVAALSAADVRRLIPEPPRRRDRQSGTHLGSLPDDVRRNRVAKNARNRARRGLATRPRGSRRTGRCSGSRRTGR